MVVLHLGQGQVVTLRLLASPFACKVLGMRIAGEAARGFLEQLAITLFGLDPGVIGFRILDIADMLRDERVGALIVGRGGAHQGERGLLLRTRGQQGFLLGLRTRAVERDGQRGEAAGTADELDGLLVAYAHHAQHRVVVARQNATVVAQDGIGDAGELDQRLIVVGDDGLVMQVSRGHDQHGKSRIALLGTQGLREIVEQQMLDGRAGQHDAQLGKVIGQTGGELRLGPLAQQHDGAFGGFQGALLRLVDMARTARVGRARYHDGERLALAALALTQLRQRIGIRGVAHQMEAAEALHRHDAAVEQQLDRFRENGVGGFAGIAPLRLLPALRKVHPADVRAAIPTGIGLRMEAAVERIGVFGGATRAHGEILHGRCGAVVGQRPDDGEARAAVRAVDERIAVATVFGVEQLVKAIVASGQIGGDQRGLLGVAIVGEADVERAEPFQRHLLEVDLLDLCGGRRVHVQLGDELVQQARLALGVDEHAFHSVENPAVELVFLRQTIHEGAKAHPLHDAFYLYVERFDHTTPFHLRFTLFFAG